MRDENDSGDETANHRRKASFLKGAAMLRRGSAGSASVRSGPSKGRPRGLSRGSISIRSVASNGSHNAQKFIENEASDESMGETDDDVCFPPDESMGINLEELNQLLDPSESSEGSPNEASPLETLINTQIKSPTELKVPFLPNKMIPDLRLPDAARSTGASSTTSISTNERNRFSFFATKLDRTIHATDLGDLVEEGQSFATLFSAENGVWWLDLESPTDAELKIISKAFGIHPLTTDDIRTGETREKFEQFSRYYFVCFHTFGNNPDNKEYYLEPITFYVLVFEDGVISFHETPVSHCKNVRRRMRQLREYVTLTSDWICYALIDDITDSFAPIMHEVEAETDKVEDIVYTGSSDSNEMSSTLSTIAETRKITMSLMRLLSGKADVVRGYAKRCGDLWASRRNENVSLYLGDIQDHIITMSQNLTASEKILSRSHANYMSYLQMEFVNASNRMTSVLSKATLLGTILVPMNLVTGMFGMNVPVPGEDATNLGWFFGILAVMILVVAVLFYMASKWLKRSSERA